MNRESLDALKLIEDNTTDAEIEAVVERAIQQYNGWGVNRTDRITLGLAVRLRDALETAESAEENHRTLKGLQMENGRLKKRLSNAEDAAKSLQAQLDKTDEVS